MSLRGFIATVGYTQKGLSTAAPCPVPGKSGTRKTPHKRTYGVRARRIRAEVLRSVHCCLKPCCTLWPGVVVVAAFLPASAGHGAPNACHRFTFAANSSCEIGIGFRPSPGFQP